MFRLAYYSAALLLVGLVMRSSCAFSSEPHRGVKWYTFEEVTALSKADPRKIIVDVYTYDCEWCRRMDEATFQHPIIAEYLNTTYYPVKLNAEQREAIVFQGQTFRYYDNGATGIHQLAAALLEHKIRYPTTVILNEQFKILHSLSGYKGPHVFDVFLKFFGEDRFDFSSPNAYTESWEAFNNEYISPFKNYPKPE